MAAYKLCAGERKEAAGMKNDLKWAAILILGVLAGVSILCAIANKRQVAAARADRDTIRVVVYDTVRIVSPEPVASTQLTPKVVRLPVVTSGANKIAQDYNKLSACVTSDAKRAEAGAASEGVINAPPALPAWVYTDSADVAVPVERKVYTGGGWRAVVSGAWVSLDTMEVYNRREVVTVRQPPDKPKRWSLGVGVGYGMTPHGMQPFVGVTLSYALLRF